MKQVYYAHCLAIYDTPQEQRDIQTLEKLHLTVYNPNNLKVQQEVKQWKEDHMGDPMGYFKNLIDDCDVFAFRALPDGSIPSGIAFKLTYAQEQQKPIIELPSGVSKRIMNYPQTVEYLREAGQR